MIHRPTTFLQHIALCDALAKEFSRKAQGYFGELPEHRQHWFETRAYTLLTEYFDAQVGQV